MITQDLKEQLKSLLPALAASEGTVPEKRTASQDDDDDEEEEEQQRCKRKPADEDTSSRQ
jgi:hypothetical protein